MTSRSAKHINGPQGHLRRYGLNLPAVKNPNEAQGALRRQGSTSRNAKNVLETQAQVRRCGAIFRDVYARTVTQRAPRRRGTEFPAINAGSDPLKFNRSQGSNSRNINLTRGKPVTVRCCGPSFHGIKLPIAPQRTLRCRGQLPFAAKVSSERIKDSNVREGANFRDANSRVVRQKDTRRCEINFPLPIQSTSAMAISATGIGFSSPRCRTSATQKAAARLNFPSSKLGLQRYGPPGDGVKPPIVKIMVER